MQKLFSSFDRDPGIIAAISTREEGSMRIADHPHVPGDIEANRTRALRSLGIDPADTVALKLVHSPCAVKVGTKDKGTVIEGVDGATASEKGLYMTVTVADCLPVFLWDKGTGAIALLHAGWRGLASGIIPNGILRLKEMGASPGDIMAGIGPGIGPCHFEVSGPLRDMFAEYKAAEYRGGKIFLDLPRVAALQLEENGILPENIEVVAECTACMPERYFSFRRDKPALVDPMIVVFGRRGDIPGAIL